MSNDDALQEAIRAIKSGGKSHALGVLAKIVKQEANNEAAWLWLSAPRLATIKNDNSRMLDAFRTRGIFCQ